MFSNQINNVKKEISFFNIPSSLLYSKIRENFDLDRLKRNHCTLYVILPRDNQHDYSPEALEMLDSVLTAAFNKKEILTTRITEIIFLVEYSLRDKEIIKYIPVDKDIVMEHASLADLIKKGCVVEII